MFDQISGEIKANCRKAANALPAAARAFRRHKAASTGVGFSGAERGSGTRFCTSHDLRGDVALAAYRVDRHDRALDRHHVEQRRDGDDLIRLLAHLDLAQHDALPRREGGGCSADLT
jgi:hypothetical protein